MESIKQVIHSMIQASDREMNQFLEDSRVATYQPYEVLAEPGVIPESIFFISHGLVRVIIADQAGDEHTIHFAFENQFIADYSGFILQQPGMYYMQALEETQVIILPRKSIEWGYSNMQEGQKLGRLIAEFYFIYHDNRIKNLYARTPLERYNALAEVFPNIHNRVPQHMIASYLGITPVHLSRLKKNNRY